MHQGKLFVFLMFIMLLSGCSDPHGCIPVSGTVTMDGAKVPADGFLYFTAQSPAPGRTARPGLAEFDVNGNYKVTSFAPGDGLMPGTYALVVECWKIPPGQSGGGVAGVSYLPFRYRNAAKSGLTLVVEPGSKPIKFDFDVSSK